MRHVLCVICNNTIMCYSLIGHHNNDIIFLAIIYIIVSHALSSVKNMTLMESTWTFTILRLKKNYEIT